MRARRQGLAARLALWALLSSGAARAAATVTTEPSPIILGRAKVVVLTIHLDPAMASARGELNVRANVGELSDPVDQGGGKFKVEYAPPPTKYPQVAVLAVWKETGQPAEVELIRIPLHGVTRIEASSKPGAEVHARVGGEMFGPAIAGKDGAAPITVAVPPGAVDVVLLARVSGVVTERTVVVEAPPYNRLAAVVTPGSLAMGPGATARLDVLHDVPGGVADPRAVSVRASAGKVMLERADGPRLRYRWEPDGAEAKEITFQVSAEGDKVSSASASLRRVFRPTLDLRVGARVGLTHSLGALAGPRYGADAWAPFRVGGLALGVGLTAGYGTGEQQVPGPALVPIARTELEVIPLALRLGVVPLEPARDLSLVVGAGVVGAVTRVRIFDPTAVEAREELARFAPGVMLFAGATWALGPGELFGELVYSRAAVDDPRFRAQAGGLGVEVGYRLDVLRGR